MIHLAGCSLCHKGSECAREWIGEQLAIMLCTVHKAEVDIVIDRGSDGGTANYYLAA